MTEEDIRSLIKVYNKIIKKKKGQIGQLKFEVEYYSDRIKFLKERLKDC